MTDKKGRWVEVAYDSGFHRCTACNKHIYEFDYVHDEDKKGLDPLPDYCPNCGAYMKEEAKG